MAIGTSEHRDSNYKWQCLKTARVLMAVNVCSNKPQAHSRSLLNNREERNLIYNAYQNY